MSVKFFNNLLVSDRLLRLVLSLLLPWFAVVVLSADYSVMQSEAVDTVLRLREVSVTGIKSGTKANQDEAIATIRQDEIDRRDIVNMKQVSEIVPNFYMPEYGSRMTSSVYVRGLGTRIDQPVVGLNIDNIPIINKDNFDFDLVDIERVEVLRGPQNILYGRNTMAGLINIYTLSPLSFEGVRANVGYGTQNDYKVAVGVYGMVSNRMGMALTVGANGTDGFYKNEFNGSKVGRERLWSMRWKTSWRPKSNVMVENTASVSHARQNGYPYQSVAGGVIAYNDTCYYRRLTVTDGLTVKHSFRGITFSSIMSFQYIDDEMTLDQDFLPLDYFTLTQKRKEWAVTADFVARGNVGKYSWLGGAFGFCRRSVMNAPVTFGDYGIAQLVEGKRNEMNPSYPIRWDDRHFLLGSDFVTPAGGASLYHESAFDAGNFTATVGLRFDWERISLRYHSSTSAGYTIFDATGVSPEVYSHRSIEIDDHETLSKDFCQLLPKFSVSYRLPSMMGNVYASATRGYKAGGYNTQMFSDVLQQRVMGQMGIAEQYDTDEVISYDPEKNWNFEIGAHLHFLDSRLDVDFAAFWTEIADQQLTMFPEGSVTGRVMANAGRSRSCGIELSSSFRMACGVSFRGAYGLTDARFREFSNGRYDYSGNCVPYAPANTLFLGVGYGIGFQHGFIDNLSADINLRGVGEIMWDEANSVMQPFYATLGASVRAAHGPFSLELWAENLTGTQYATFYFVSIGNAFLQRGKRFSCGVTARWNLNF